MQLIRKQEPTQQQPSIWDNVFTVDNVFDRMLSDFWKPFGMLPRADRWMPRVDVTEDKDAYRITADVPGVDPKDVTVEMVGDTLQVYGKSEHTQREERGNWLRMERQAGEFSRSFSLPSDVDADAISAQTRHGVVTITLPKKPEAKREAKKIEVHQASEKPGE